MSFRSSNLLLNFKKLVAPKVNIEKIIKEKAHMYLDASLENNFDSLL